MKWTLINPAGTNDPDTGDIYSGLDRFGRVKDNRWLDGAGDDLDRIQYGYDRAGNRIWRRNVVAAALGKEFDELYGYDAIHRLKHMARGTLNGGRTALTSETFAQCWTLDSTGNWQGFREDDDGSGTWDLVQQRSANTVNEISGITETAGPSWVTPAYSRAGNMTTLPQPADPTQSYTATYDAWNRLVKIADGADTVAEYQYDGARRRIVQKSYTGGVLDETRHLYYTQPSQWQVIEERVGSSPDSAPAERQFIWGRRYVDDLVLRDRDTDANGALNERLYASQDANWNVTGLVNDAEVVQERYAYSAYGLITDLNSDFIPNTSSLDLEYLYSAYRTEVATKLNHVRNRVHNSPIGGWGQRDPIGYLAIDMNLYCYVQGNPQTYTDPLGESAATSISCGNARNQCYARCVTDPDPSTCQANCDTRFNNCMPKPPAPPPPPPPPIGPPTYCGLLEASCCPNGGTLLIPVYGGSGRAKEILSLDPNYKASPSGCVTLPSGVECTYDCEAIKKQRAPGAVGPTPTLLDHEACHYCLLKLKGLDAYLRSAGRAPDGCVGNEVNTRPDW